MIFSENYSKLELPEFTTIRKNTGFYKVGCTYWLTVSYFLGMTKMARDFQATVVNAVPIKKADMTDDIARRDADCVCEELIAKLEGWYGKKYDDYVLLTLRKVA